MIRLKQCAKNPHHRYSDHSAACPWCRMVQDGSPDPFPGSERMTPAVQRTDREKISRTPDIPAETPRTPLAPPSTSRKWIYLGILIVVIAIIMGASVVLKGPASSPLPWEPEGSITSPLSGEGLGRDDYTASYSWDGNLEEKFFYRVTESDAFTMLYRYFDAPLITGSLPEPHIEFLSLNAPGGTTGYVRDTTGKVSFPNGGGDQNALQGITAKAQKNEAGIYRAGGFSPGIYPVVYRFRFYPPVEYDAAAVHLNIRLMESHPAYEHIRILVPSDSVREIYFSPSHLSVSKTNTSIIAEGALAKDEALSFEVILDREILGTIPGFPEYTEDVIGKTEAANPGQNPFRP